MSKVLATAALLAGSHLHHAYLGTPGSSISDGNQIPMDDHVFSRHLNMAEDGTENEAANRAWEEGAVAGNAEVPTMDSMLKSDAVDGSDGALMEAWMEGYIAVQHARDAGWKAGAEATDPMPELYKERETLANAWSNGHDARVKYDAAARRIAYRLGVDAYVPGVHRVFNPYEGSDDDERIAFDEGLKDADEAYNAGFEAKEAGLDWKASAEGNERVAKSPVLKWYYEGWHKDATEKQVK